MTLASYLLGISQVNVFLFCPTCFVDLALLLRMILNDLTFHHDFLHPSQNV